MDTASAAAPLPRVLVIDDLFGRRLPGRSNPDRRRLCGAFLLDDEEEGADRRGQAGASFVAAARFCRGQQPATASTGDEVVNDLPGTLDAVRAGWTDALAAGRLPWSLVLLDLCFYTGRVTGPTGVPDGQPADTERYFGLTILEALRTNFPDLPVVALTSKPREGVSLDLSRLGAVGFIGRDDPRGPDLLRDAIRQHGLLPDTGGVIGHSLPLLLALRDARRAAGHRQSVLIRGERGTGKELMAGYLYRSGSRPGGRPFIPVNAAAFAPGLFAAELFGVEPRVATGVDGKAGLVELANGGDLFLDEIADMPADIQAAVLRVIQEGQYLRVGGVATRTADVRFVSATNARIERAGRLRADLVDRLRVGGTISLPPLRERMTDVPLLANGFVREQLARQPELRPRQVTPEALARLLEYDWPGNVRELRGVILDAVCRYPDADYLVPAHLRIPSARAGRKARGAGRLAAAPAPAGTIAALVSQLDEIEFAHLPPEVWSGRLGEVQRAAARMVARLLRAALDATRRRGPLAPEGRIQIHPAVKLLTGDPAVTASRAADLVKRLLGPIEGELTGDLAEAYRVARRLRPSVPGGTGRATGPEHP